jgi:hypothetical protein
VTLYEQFFFNAKIYKTHKIIPDKKLFTRNCRSDIFTRIRIKINLNSISKINMAKAISKFQSQCQNAVVAFKSVLLSQYTFGIWSSDENTDGFKALC